MDLETYRLLTAILALFFVVLLVSAWIAFAWEISHQLRRIGNALTGPPERSSPPERAPSISKPRERVIGYTPADPKGPTT